MGHWESESPLLSWLCRAAQESRTACPDSVDRFSSGRVKRNLYLRVLRKQWLAIVAQDECLLWYLAMKMHLTAPLFILFFAGTSQPGEKQVTRQAPDKSPIWFGSPLKPGTSGEYTKYYNQAVLETLGP